MSSRSKIRPAVGALILLYLGMAPRAVVAQQVSYHVAFPNAAHHEAHVEVTFTGMEPGQGLALRMSRASPGRYALHEFAKNIYDVEAFDGSGDPLEIRRPDPHQWDVDGAHDGTVRVGYTVFGDRADGTYTAIDPTHAHLNMPATFLWARDWERARVRIAFDPPRPEWKIATQLFPTEDPTVFTAPDLAYFLDSPTELSAHSVRTWRVDSNGEIYTMRLAVHHQGSDRQLDAFAAMVQRIVAEEIAVYGETPRFETGRYTFIADYLPYVSPDGMEHRNSTILTSRNPPSATGPQANLDTLAHEFFHAWNVERIRPLSLEPFDLEDANMSGELWFAEGFTSYYAPLLLHRAGIIETAEYASRVSRVIDTVINSPGRALFSPVEMSMRAPFIDAAASIDPQNTENTFVSYYTWGAAIGLGLDLTLRQQYGTNLDDYMRALWRQYGRTERPYTIPDLRRVLGEVSGDTAFAENFFQRYIEGREVPDYAALLKPAGLLLRQAHPGSVWLGANVVNRQGRSIVGSRPLAGSPLYEAGLDVEAVLLEVDGQRLSGNSLDALLASRNPGDRLTINYTFRGETLKATLVLAQDPALEVVTYETAGLPLPEAALAFRRSWLGGKQ